MNLEYIMNIRSLEKITSLISAYTDSNASGVKLRLNYSLHYDLIDKYKQNKVDILGGNYLNIYPWGDILHYLCKIKEFQYQFERTYSTQTVECFYQYKQELLRRIRIIREIYKRMGLYDNIYGLILDNLESYLINPTKDNSQKIIQLLQYLLETLNIKDSISSEELSTIYILDSDSVPSKWNKDQVIRISLSNFHLIGKIEEKDVKVTYFTDDDMNYLPNIYQSKGPIGLLSFTTAEQSLSEINKSRGFRYYRKEFIL